MNTEYFLSINDVSKRLDLPAHTLRYWEKQFPVAIKPTTGAGGRRYYRPETVDALGVIKELLYTRGMTIAGVKKLIKEGTLQSASADFAASSKPVAPDAPRATPKSTTPKATTPDTLFSSNSDIEHAIDLLERARKVLK